MSNSVLTVMSRDFIYLSLGSNLGDREANLRKAIRLLKLGLGVGCTRISEFITTKSWGFDAPDFLNAVAVFPVGKADPFEVLDLCKRIEREMGRTDGPEYGEDGKRIYHSRIIDIDILLFGELRLDTPQLKIPHPLMWERDFVTVPLRQVMEDN